VNGLVGQSHDDRKSDQDRQAHEQGAVQATEHHQRRSQESEKGERLQGLARVDQETCTQDAQSWGRSTRPQKVASSRKEHHGQHQAQPEVGGVRQGGELRAPGPVVSMVDGQLPTRVRQHQERRQDPGQSDGTAGWPQQADRGRQRRPRQGEHQGPDLGVDGHRVEHRPPGDQRQEQMVGRVQIRRGVASDVEEVVQCQGGVLGHLADHGEVERVLDQRFHVHEAGDAPQDERHPGTQGHCQEREGRVFGLNPPPTVAFGSRSGPVCVVRRTSAVLT